MPSRTGLITLSGAPSQMLPLTRANHACRWQPAHAHTPQHRTRNPCQVLHAHGLASSAIARHYTRNHKLFSSPTGTEMFHFPASTPTQTMHSPAGNTTQPVLGFPIRTSSDQRFVGNSPRHNAASHVLHRLSMPRHPPYARNKTHGHTNKQVQTPKHKKERYSRPLYSSHTTQPHTQTTTTGHPCDKGPTGTTNAAPDTQQCTNAKTLLSRKLGASTNPNTTQHTPQHQPPTPPSKQHQRLRVCLHPAKTKHMAVTHSATQPHNTHNCGPTIKTP